MMDVSAAYLSRVEHDADPPSAGLIVKMAQLYRRPVEDFTAVAKKPAVAAEARGRALQLTEDLRALYRMGGTLTPEEVEDMIRYVLRKRNLADEEIERELIKLRSELPRIRNNGRDGLFAADVKPRFLSKARVASIAYALLATNGIDVSTYVPPTPLEMLVERQAGVTYKISELPSKGGEPVVLGLSKWNGPYERQIIINSTLADSPRQTDDHRFSFTLAHELFHTIEHLPRALACGVSSLMRAQVQDTIFVDHAFSAGKHSVAQSSVERWASRNKPRALVTDEDWREWQANSFASALLMPEWAVIATLKRRLRREFITAPPGSNAREVALAIAGDNLLEGIMYQKSLADLFGVSRQAMAIRLLDLGFIREVTAS